MKNSELTWTGSPDDMTARSGEYVLRVEQMDDYWWWCIYFGSVAIDADDAIDETTAKAAAIAAMNEHLKEK